MMQKQWGALAAAMPGGMVRGWWLVAGE